MKKTFRLIGVIACIAVIGLAFFGCKEEDSTPQEHSGTITAFGKTITVKGDASISKANFEKAKGKLQEAMSNFDYPTMPNTFQEKYDTMFNLPGFMIIIETGAAYDGCKRVGNTMAFHIDYLLNNDAVPTIVASISLKVGTDIFK